MRKRDLSYTTRVWIDPDAWSEDAIDRWALSASPREGWVECYVAPYTCPNTYQTDLVSESNRDAFAELVDGADGEADCRETRECGWIVAVACEDDVILDAIASLEAYPILDDDDHSRRQMEHAEEQWNDWGRQETLRAFEAYHGVDLDDCDDADLDDFFRSDGIMTHGWDREHAICANEFSDDPTWDVRPWLVSRSELLEIPGAVDDDEDGEGRRRWRERAMEQARDAAETANRLGWKFTRVRDTFAAPAVVRLARIYRARMGGAS